MGVLDHKLSSEERKLISLKAKAAREKIYQLVVKIISWETGADDSTAIQSANKISGQEWTDYKNHLINISKSDSLEQIQGKLSQTFKDIKKHGGFK